MNSTVQISRKCGHCGTVKKTKQNADIICECPQHKVVRWRMRFARTRCSGAQQEVKSVPKESTILVLQIISRLAS